jgi:hypothetical protein
MAPDTVPTPQSEQELADLVREGAPIQVIGSGTKRHHGPPARAGRPHRRPPQAQQDHGL